MSWLMFTPSSILIRISINYPDAKIVVAVALITLVGAGCALADLRD